MTVEEEYSRTGEGGWWDRPSNCVLAPRQASSSSLADAMESISVPLIARSRSPTITRPALGEFRETCAKMRPE